MWCDEERIYYDKAKYKRVGLYILWMSNARVILF
jgi:hypothetical protein